ncbi:hypothetical protein ABPG74_009327 [Tetrahymena malaccensis]
MVKVYFLIKQYQPEQFEFKNGKFEKIDSDSVNQRYGSFDINNSCLVSRKQIKITYQQLRDMIHSQNIEFYDEKIEIKDQGSENPQVLEENNEEKNSYCLNQKNYEQFFFHVQILDRIAEKKYERYRKNQEVENQTALIQQVQKDLKKEEKKSCFMFVTAKPENEETHLQTDKELKKILSNINKNPDIIISKRFQQIKRNLCDSRVEIIHFGTHIKQSEDKKIDQIHLEKEDNQLDKIELQQLGKLFQRNIHKPKIVFLNCCHSQLFLNHIEKSNNQISWILIDKDYGISDNISIKFASRFYKELFSKELDKINLKEAFDQVQLDLCLKYIQSPQAFNVGDLFNEKQEKSQCNCMQLAIKYILENAYKQINKQEQMEVLLKYASQFIFFHNKKNEECQANKKNEEFQASKEELENIAKQEAQKKIQTIDNQIVIFKYYEYYQKQNRKKSKISSKRSKLLLAINQKPLGVYDKNMENEKLLQKMYDQIHAILLVYLQKYCPFYRYILIQPQKQQLISIDYNDGYPHIKSGFVNFNIDSDFIKNNTVDFADLKKKISDELQINNNPKDQSDQISDQINNQQFAILDLNHTQKIKQQISMCLANNYENQFQNELAVEFFPTQKISSKDQNSDQYAQDIVNYIKNNITNEQVSKKLKDKKQILHVFVFKKYSNLKEINKKKDHSNLKQLLIESIDFPNNFLAIIAIVDSIQYNTTIQAGLKSQIEVQLKNNNQKYCILNIDQSYKIKQTIFMCLRDIQEKLSEKEYCAEYQYHATQKIQQNQQDSNNFIEQHIQSIIQQQDMKVQNDNKIIFHIFTFKNYSSQETNKNENITNLRHLIEKLELQVKFRIIIIIINVNHKKVDLNEIQDLFYNKQNPLFCKNINTSLINSLNETNKKEFEEQTMSKLNHSQHKQLQEIDLNSKQVLKEIIKFLARKNLIHLNILSRRQFNQESQQQTICSQESQFLQQIIEYFLKQNQLNFQFLYQEDILIYKEIIKNKNYFKSNSMIMQEIILLFLSNILFQPYKQSQTLKYDKIIEYIQKYESEGLLQNIKYLKEMLQYIKVSRMLKASEANPNIFNYSFINYIQLNKRKVENSESQDILKILLIQLIKSVEENVAYNYASSKDEYMKIESKKFLKRQLFMGIENIISQISSQNQFQYNVLFLNVSLERVMLRFKMIFEFENYQKLMNKNEGFAQQINQIIEFARNDDKLVQKEGQDQLTFQALIQNIKKLISFIELYYDEFMQILEVQQKKNLSIDGLLTIADSLMQNIANQKQMITQDQLKKFIEKYCIIKYYFIFENKQGFKNTLFTAKNLDSLIEKLKIRCLFQFSIIKDSFLSFEEYEQIRKILIIDAYYSKNKFMIQDKKQLSFELIEQQDFYYKINQSGIEYLKLIFLFTNQKEYIELFQRLNCQIVYFNVQNNLSEKQVGQIKIFFEEFIEIYFTNLLDKNNKNIFSSIFYKSLNDFQDNKKQHNAHKLEEFDLFIQNIAFSNNSKNLHIDINFQECCEYKSYYPYFKQLADDHLSELLSNVKEDNLQTTWLQKYDSIPQYLKEYISNIYENIPTQIAADNYTDTQNFNTQVQVQYDSNFILNTQPSNQEENTPQQAEYRQVQPQDNKPGQGSKLQILTKITQFISMKNNQPNVGGMQSKISKNNQQISKNNQQNSKNKSKKTKQNSIKNKENQIYKNQQGNSPDNNSLDQNKKVYNHKSSYENKPQKLLEFDNQFQEPIIGYVDQGIVDDE